MSTSGPPADCVAAALEESRVPADARTRAVLVELWSARAVAAPFERVALPAAETLGRVAVDAGVDEGELVRRVLRLGRTLAEVALRRGDVDAPGSLHLVALSDEAASRALVAYVRARTDRRDVWLSYLTHEIKNPLNTLLNALWLLREHRESSGADRFFQLAERAVRRIEATTRQIRELQRHDTDPPPTKSDASPSPADPAKPER